MLLPSIAKNTHIRLKTISSIKGLSGTHLGRKFSFETSTTDTDSLFADPEVNTIFIATRHNTHGSLVLQALKAGKKVFVEKPLCLSMEELNKIIETYNEILNSNSVNSDLPLLMVGFNRRFSPLVQAMKQKMKAMAAPASMIMTVNAGQIPIEHWTQEKKIGGGRIIGEACHFIDLLRYLAGSPLIAYDKTSMDSKTADTVSIGLRFKNGSIGTIHYFANGPKTFPKERLEIFCDGKIMQLDNFRTIRGFGFKMKGFKKRRLWRQDKGQNEEVRIFLDAIRKGQVSPIPFDEIIEVTRATFDLAEN
jgi:predicted dehydrogenase